ncbi:hypothetical protein TNCT_452511 [Trichonephila clavata]|uniref:Uncharacterized protein n=1 Tax=Trichonephila clavata TaxID=2740835 RepID=A0A8X6GC39_TRICU|nr:hypothetical protein TNCT_452511 [Trichonephila clavata]
MILRNLWQLHQPKPVPSPSKKNKRAARKSFPRSPVQRKKHPLERYLRKGICHLINLFVSPFIENFSKRLDRFQEIGEARIKDSSGGFVNQETEVASESPQSPNISDEKRSPQTKSAKESYAKSLPFSSPKKGSPNRSEGNTPEKIKKQKYRSLLD